MSAARKGVAGSSAVMFAGTLVSRLLGMVKSPVLLGAAIGLNTGAANAFSVSNKLPNLIYMLIAGGVLNAVLVPQIVRAVRESADRGQAYVNRLLTLAIVALAAVTTVLTLASPLLIRLYASGLPEPWFELAVTFGYWCIPQLFFYGMYTLLGQVLNARGIFGPYMWAPVLNNVVAIAGLVAYLLVFGGVSAVDPADPGAWDGGRISLLAGTATLGIVAQAVVLLVPLRRAGFRFRPTWGLRGSGLGRAGRVATWVFAALAANQAAYVVVSNAAALASRLGQGSLDVPGNAGYDAAFLVYTLPTSLVVVSLVTALFTRMSEGAAGGDLDAVRADLSVGLRTVGVFTVLAAGGLMVLALPVVRVIAPAVTYPEVQSIARVVVAMLGGLVAVGVFTVAQRVYYAFEDARGLFRLQLPMVATLAAGAALSMLLPAEWIVVGVGVAMTVSNWLGAVLTYLGLRRHLRWVDGGRVLRTHLRLVLAVVPATLAGWGVLHLLGTSSAELGVWGALWRIALVGTLMGAVYVGLLRLLDVGELGTLTRPVGRAVGAAGRRVPGPAGRLLVAVGAAMARGAVHATPRDDHGPDDGPDDDGPGGGPGDGPGDGDAPGPGGGPGGDVPRADAPGPDVGAFPGPDGVPAAPGPPRLTEDLTGAGVRTLGDDGRAGTDAGEGGGSALVRKEQTTGTTRPLVLGGRYELGHALDADAADTERWRAHDTILDRDVEALVLTTAMPEVLDAARRASLVEDHRLAHVLDVGGFYVVTDVVSGPDLGEIVARGPLEPTQARAVVGEAAAALESARRHGVRHLALRPTSIHVTPDGQVLVTGLGTDAALLGATDPDTDPLAADRRDATDLVRLLHLALTGVWPAEGDDVAAPRQAQPSVPAELDDLCVRTLSGDGPRSTGELIRELAPWGDLDPAALAPSQPHRPSFTPVRGGRAVLPAPGAATEAVPGATEAVPGAVTEPVSGATGNLVPAWLPGDAPPPPPPPPPPTDGPVTPTEAVEAPERRAGSAAPAMREQPSDGGAVTAAVMGWTPNAPAGAGAPDFGAILHGPGAPAARDSITWSPTPPETSGPPPFSDIVEGAAPAEASPARHSRVTGALAAAGVVAADAARVAAGSVATGARRAAEATREGSATARARLGEGSASARARLGPVAERARTDVGSAVAAGRARLAERGDAPAPARAPDEERGRAPGREPEGSGELPFGERRIDPTPVVLVAFAALVVVLLVLSVRTLLAPTEDVSIPDVGPRATAQATPTATPEPTPEPTEAPPPEPAAATPVIASLAPLDPQGDGAENPELTWRATDGDPATFWRSRSYVNPEYGMKEGIGLAVTLQENSTVSTVEIDLRGTGGLVQIRATDPATPTEGEVLAEGEMGPGSVFTFAEPVETQTLVLWFPRLPVAESDGRNRIELGELRVG